MKDSIIRHLRITLARDLKSATKKEIWMATCHAVRDQIIDRFIHTQEKYSNLFLKENKKQNLKKLKI